MKNNSHLLPPILKTHEIWVGFFFDKYFQPNTLMIIRQLKSFKTGLQQYDNVAKMEEQLDLDMQKI